MHLLLAYSYTPFGLRNPTVIHTVEAFYSRFGLGQIDTVALPVVTGTPDWAMQIAAIRMHQAVNVHRGQMNRLITLDYAACALIHPDKVAWLFDLPADVNPTYLREARRIFAASPDIVKQLHDRGLDSQLLSLSSEPASRPGLKGWEPLFRKLLEV